MDQYPVMTLLFLIFGLAGQAMAAGTPPATDLESRAAHCHALMTEAECVTHLDTMASLAPGAERVRYLVAHLVTRQERERLCACHQATQSITYYPDPRQAVLRY